MFKKYIYIIILLFLIIIALILVYKKVDLRPPQEIKPTDLVASQTETKPLATEKFAIIFNFGEGDSQQIMVEATDNVTALKATEKAAQQAGLEIIKKLSSAGEYIDSIGGKAGGADGKYWLYYVNDEQAPTSADKLKLKAGDKVEWKFEKPPF